MKMPKRVLPLESDPPSLVTKTDPKRDLHGISSPKAAARILFVQTEAPSYLSPAIEKLREKLYPQCEIVLLCREYDRNEFETNAHIYQILTYSKQHLRSNLQLVRQIKKVDPDMVAAVFSRRPIFRKQRLFFCLLPVRNRLVFDENLDRFHLSWRNIHRFLINGPDIGVLGILLPRAIRVLLFFPRFFYLMLWVTLMKLKRVASEGRSKSETEALAPDSTKLEYYFRHHPLLERMVPGDREKSGDG